MFCISDELLRKLLLPQRLPLDLGQCRTSIKAIPALHSLIRFAPLLLLRKQVHLQPQDMSCYNQCLPCQPCGPTPLANSCTEPCVRQCQNSTVIIEPSPVVVTLPGPILSSFPQNTVVGSSTSAAVGSILSSQGVPINSSCHRRPRRRTPRNPEDGSGLSTEILAIACRGAEHPLLHLQRQAGRGVPGPSENMALV
ncbi:hypothetical protein QYF61_022381 [Mycteria americana]|uniref:Keratin n=1 Tax=Mycteria americana TaxID=33587 RepID=A0AAN7RRK8_MYCAM|nr:hypothetical protein QYF61_022381 [Mycteria americana]